MLLLLSYLQLLQQGLPLLVDLVDQCENCYFNLVLHFLVSLGQLFQPGLPTGKKRGLLQKCFYKLAITLRRQKEKRKKEKQAGISMTIRVAVLQVGLLTCTAPE